MEGHIILSAIDLKLFLIKEPNMEFLLSRTTIMRKLASYNNICYIESISLDDLCDYELANILLKLDDDISGDKNRK